MLGIPSLIIRGFNLRNQRVLTLLRVLIDLRTLGLSDILGKYTAGASSRSVNHQHDLRRLLSIHSKEGLKHLNDEFHGRIVIIEHDNLPKWRLRKFWLLRRYN